MKTNTQVVDALLNKEEAVDGADYYDIFQLLKCFDKKAYYKSELFKRLSMALAPLSFGLVGLAFGLNISRTKSAKSIAYGVMLATIYMVSVVVGKSLRSNFMTVLYLYTSVHAIMMCASLFKIKRIERGHE